MYGQQNIKKIGINVFVGTHFLNILGMISGFRCV